MIDLLALGALVNSNTGCDSTGYYACGSNAQTQLFLFTHTTMLLYAATAAEYFFYSLERISP